jgi:hypothetical protein
MILHSPEIQVSEALASKMGDHGRGNYSQQPERAVNQQKKLEEAAKKPNFYSS